MSDPRRLLDEGSEASPLLRSLLASAKRADEPRAHQVAAVSAGLAPLLAPIVPPPVVPPPVKKKPKPAPKVKQVPTPRPPVHRFGLTG